MSRKTDMYYAARHDLSSIGTIEYLVEFLNNLIRDDGNPRRVADDESFFNWYKNHIKGKVRWAKRYYVSYLRVLKKIDFEKAGAIDIVNDAFSGALELLKDSDCYSNMIYTDGKYFVANKNFVYSVYKQAGLWYFNLCCSTCGKPLPVAKIIKHDIGDYIVCLRCNNSTQMYNINKNINDCYCKKNQCIWISGTVCTSPRVAPTTKNGHTTRKISVLSKDITGCAGLQTQVDVDTGFSRVMDDFFKFIYNGKIENENVKDVCCLYGLEGRFVKLAEGFIKLHEKQKENA